MMFGYGWNGFGWGGGIMMLGMAIFWIVIIFFGFSFFRRIYINGNYPGPGHHFHGDDNSMEILRQRYAKGEISDEEFQRMKEHLK